MVEGKQVVRRLLSESLLPIHSVLVLDKQLSHLQDILDRKKEDFPVYLVDSTVMNNIVGFDFHRGIIALGKRKAYPNINEIASKASALVLLEGLSSPDNVGSIFRNAAGLGADALVLDSSCADPLYRMATRVSIGTSLIMPWTRVEDWPEVLKELKEQGFTLIGMTPGASAIDLSALDDKPKKWALILGSEGPGLSDQTRMACDLLLKIPMARNLDSLNVATAAALGLYELV